VAAAERLRDAILACQVSSDQRRRRSTAAQHCECPRGGGRVDGGEEQERRAGLAEKNKSVMKAAA